MAEMTYGEALRATLEEEMGRDPALMLIGEDIGRFGGVFGVTKGLLDKFGPQRVRSTPISEATIVGAALGAAMTGTRTVAELMYVDFVGCAMDQLMNQVAKMQYMSGGKLKAPLVIRTTQGGGRGNAAQHSQSLESLFLHIPGLKIVLPSCPHDARGLLRSAIRDDNPVLFIEHKMLYATRGPVGEGDHLIPFGQAAVKREGRDVTLVTLSQMVQRALKAAEKLAAEGIEVEVVDLRTLVPMDLETVLASVRKTNRAVVAHEACRRGGWGAEVAAEIQARAFDHLDAPVARVGARAVPVPYSKPLEDFVIPNEEWLVEAVREVVGKR